MKIQYRIRGLNTKGELEPLIEKNLGVLSQLIPISHAAVVLNKQPETAPPFQVSVLLAVPGPDIHAEASDHTLRAAWQKLWDNLQKQFQRRVDHRELRMRDGEQFRSPDFQRSTVAGR